jgi:putative hydrolase of the HAD superfamily
MRAGVIFDGDDTLWETQSLYNEAKRLFFSEMKGTGFDFGEVRERFEAIDRSNVSRLGFSRRRFPQSMCDTYRSFCDERLSPTEPEMMERIRSIGESVFEATAPVADGAAKTLETLKAASLILLLATKGDTDVQRVRIHRSGLGEYFDGQYILPEKGRGEFSLIVSEWELEVERSWSVGNSPRSDIAPALGVGLCAIFLRNVGWTYEDQELPSSPRLYFAATLREVPSIIVGGGSCD